MHLISVNKLALFKIIFKIPDMKKLLLLIVVSFFVICCNNIHEKSMIGSDAANIKDAETKNEIIKKRDSIVLKLQNKIESHEALVVHAFVALYGYNFSDYNNMRTWEDGTDPVTNLYWGAGYGIKTYFSRYDDWKLVFEQKNLSDTVLERLVFTKKFSNGAEVYLIADAYIGYEMETCLKNYFSALSEENSDSVVLGNKTIPANGNADLIVFNGHNGLMDYLVNPELHKSFRQKETAVIACYSGRYFMDYFRIYHTYPLITTCGLIPAEAYILASIIESWALLKTGQDIRQNIITRYSEIHKCPESDVENLFATGWYLGSK